MEERKEFEVYSDTTGRGDGDFLGGFATLEAARAFGERGWEPAVGYAIYQNNRIIVKNPPTHPEEGEPYNDDPYNETGRY